MHTTLEKINGIAVLSLNGQLDDQTVDLFLGQIKQMVDSGFVRVVVDLGGIDFLSGSGLRALLTGLRSVRQQGGDLRLIRVPRQAYRLLTITGAQHVLGVYPNISAALTVLRSQVGVDQILCPAAC